MNVTFQIQQMDLAKIIKETPVNYIKQYRALYVTFMNVSELWQYWKKIPLSRVRRPTKIPSCTILELIL